MLKPAAKPAWKGICGGPLLHTKFNPYYQPLMELSKGKLIGFEILARWPHASLGLIAPDIFIPIAEKLGLISTLTHGSFADRLYRFQDFGPDDLILGTEIFLHSS